MTRPAVPLFNGVPTEDGGIEVPTFSVKVRQWRVIASPDGLRIEANPEYQGPLREMEFRAAYGLLNRTGFRSHEPSDFSFHDDPAMVAEFDASVERDHNQLKIVPNSRDFFVEIKGFDHRRSLDYSIAVDSASDAQLEEDD